jgi:hypothetical protein
MKIRRLGIVSAAAVTLLLLIGVARGSTPGDSTTSARSSKEAERVRATERTRLRALVEANVKIARKLSADNFQLVNPASK